MVRRIGFTVIVAMLLAASSGYSQPATQPVELTAQQQKIIKAANSWPADVPAPRIDIAPYNKDGTPNENFGKPRKDFILAHEGFLERTKQPVGVLFIGDSITAGWARDGKAVWAERYAPLEAANFGINGDRTDYVLWRIDHGELDNIKPRVVVLMIGTNNYGSSAAGVVKGVQAVVTKVHQKLPDTKVLLLGIFPRGAAATDAQGRPDAGRAKLLVINAELAKLDDGKKSRYLEVWEQFLQADGSIAKEVMPDALHPSEKGYRIWAEAMQPLLDQMLKQ